MAQVTSQLLVRLINGVSGPAAAAARSLRQLQLAAQVGGGAIGRAYSKVALAQELNAARTERLTGAFFNAATGAAALGYALSFPIRAGMEYDKLLTAIEQKMNASKSTMVDVHRTITKVASETRANMSDVASAFDAAVSRGLDPLKNEAALTASALAAVAYKDVNIMDMIELNRSLSQNLRLTNDELQRGNDILAAQGKSGAFEIASSAKIMPSLASAMEAKGFSGIDTVISLGAALQVVQKATANSAIAGNDLYNLLTKATSPETVRKFKKLGMDIEEELKKGREAGEDFFDTLVKIVDTATGGDQTQVGKLWEDMQAQRALRALLQFRKEYKEFKEIGKESNDTVLRDWEKAVASNQGKWAALGRALHNFSTSFGKAIAPDAGNIAERLTHAANSASRWVSQNERLVASITKVVAAIASLRLGLAALNLVGSITAGWVLATAGALTRIGAAATTLGRALLWPISSLRRFAIVAAVALTLGGATGAFSAMRAGIAALGATILTVLNPVSAFRAAMSAFAVGGPIALGLAAFVAAGAAIYQNWSNIGTFFQTFAESFTKALSPETLAAIQPFVGAIRDLLNWFSALPDKITLSQSAVVAFGEAAGRVVGSGVNALISAIRSVANAFQWVINKAQAAISAIRNFVSSSATIQGAAAMGLGASAAPSGGGKRASGGPVHKGGVYTVGERGPELFVPSRSGSILKHGTPLDRGGTTISPSFVFNIAGDADPQKIKAEIMRALRDHFDELFRAAHADTGIRWA